MKQATSPSFGLSALQKLLILVLPVLLLGCPGPDKTVSTTNTEPEITQVVKLEMLKADYDVLKAAAGMAGGFTFQFAYDKAKTPRLTLAAYAEKPGRDFQPPTLKYLTPVDPVSPLALPDQFTLGDQYLRFNGPNGLDQLLAQVPTGVNFYSITFTPNLLTTPIPSGTPASVVHIRYIVCVKYKNPATGAMIEVCGAGAVETHPSPPAN